MIARPQTDEYAQFYAGYISHIPEGADIFALMKSQPDELRALLANISDEQANVKPAPGEWSIKEVVGHMCDTERILSYRAVRIGRGDATPLASFEQDDFVRGTNFNARTLPDLVEEFSLQRRANVLCFSAFTDEEIARWGTASEWPITVRALLHILVGHVIHHSKSLQTDYHVSA
jgi:hypothetical protein